MCLEARHLSPNRVTSLHALVLTGSSDAIEEIGGILLRRVRLVLTSQMSHVDPAILNDSADDAILKYLQDPSRYDASRARLETFITFIARRKVIDALDREARRRRAEGRAAEAGRRCEFRARRSRHKRRRITVCNDATTVS